MTDHESLYNQFMLEMIMEDRIAKERRELHDRLVRFNVNIVKLRQLSEA